MKVGPRQPTFSRMTWHGFNLVDGIVLAMLLGGLIGGIRRGLSGELARVLVAAACVFVIYRYTRPFAEWIQGRHHFETHLALLLSVILLLIGTYAAATLIRMSLSSILNFAFKGKLERIGGALAGLIRSAIIAALLLVLASFLPLESARRTITEESVSGRFVSTHVAPWYDKMAEKIPELGMPQRAEEHWDEDAFQQKLDKWERENETLGPVDEE